MVTGAEKKVAADFEDKEFGRLQIPSLSIKGPRSSASPQEVHPSLLPNDFQLPSMTDTQVTYKKSKVSSSLSFLYMEERGRINLNTISKSVGPELSLSSLRTAFFAAIPNL